MCRLIRLHPKLCIPWASNVRPELPVLYWNLTSKSVDQLSYQNNDTESLLQKVELKTLHYVV